MIRSLGKTLSAIGTSKGEAPQVTDRRAAPRALLEVEVTFSSRHNFYVGMSGDISEGGLFVATAEPRSVGAAVLMGFGLPTSKRPIEALGVVRWVRLPQEARFEPPGMGIRFVSLSEEAAHAIKRFLWSRVPLLWE
jgi:uncharacterized protein (TIGR02266 family)